MGLSELNNVSLAVTYDLDNTFDESRFIKMRLRVCHDGINPNGSNFNVDDMNAAKDTLKNIPILANVVFDEDGQPQFGSHDMAIEKDKVHEGEYRMVYKEVPIGLIPEINNYEVAEYDGRNYVYVDGYVWRKYSNYAEDIIERDKNIKLSMEIDVNEFTFNAAKKVYNITDYKYTAITFLNNDLGTGMKKAMATTETFENKDADNEMLIIMQELKEALVTFNKKNTEEGGIANKMENTENIITEAVTDSETPVETSETPAEDAVITETPDSEVPAETVEAETAKFVKSFELSHEDVRCGLYALLAQKEAETNDWYYIQAVYDDYFVYSSETERKLFKQEFTKENDNIAFNGDPVEVYMSILTAEEKSAIEALRANYSAMETELGELKAYKENVEKNTVLSEKNGILDKWTENLKGDAKFEALKDSLDNYSVEELERECKCIFADAKANFTFAAKPKDDSVVRIAVTDEKSVPASPYGDLFEKYGRNYEERK